MSLRQIRLHCPNDCDRPVFLGRAVCECEHHFDANGREMQSSTVISELESPDMTKLVCSECGSTADLMRKSS